MPPRNSRYIPLSGGPPGLLENQGGRSTLAEGGGPSSNGVRIPVPRLAPYPKLSILGLAARWRATVPAPWVSAPE